MTQTMPAIAVYDVPKTYGAAVASLAAAHADGDDGIVVYCLPDPQGKVVRLIEVSDAFPEAGVERPAAPGGFEWVVPVFPMGPARDFPFRSEVAQVTRDEWGRLRAGELRLNRDWNLDDAVEVTVGE